MRTFLIPKIGDGLSKQTAFRRAYVAELAVRSRSSIDCGDFYVVRSDDDDATLDQLAGRPGVQEIKEDATPMAVADRARINTRIANKLAVNSFSTGEELVRELWQAGMVRQFLSYSQVDKATVAARVAAQVQLQGN